MSYSVNSIWGCSRLFERYWVHLGQRRRRRGWALNTLPLAHSLQRQRGPRGRKRAELLDQAVLYALLCTAAAQALETVTIKWATVTCCSWRAWGWTRYHQPGAATEPRSWFNALFAARRGWAVCDMCSAQWTTRDCLPVTLICRRTGKYWRICRWLTSTKICILTTHARCSFLTTMRETAACVSRWLQTLTLDASLWQRMVWESCASGCLTVTVTELSVCVLCQWVSRVACPARAYLPSSHCRSSHSTAVLW
jgi:hypothetical protein